METNIKIPEGMLEALHTAMCTKIEGGCQPDYERAALEAALRWLSDNPIVPTVDQAQEIWAYVSRGESFLRNLFVEWQRRMFLAPEPEEPEKIKEEKIKDLLWRNGIYNYERESEEPDGGLSSGSISQHNRLIIEAYNRGLKGGK